MINLIVFLEVFVLGKVPAFQKRLGLFWLWATFQIFQFSFSLSNNFLRMVKLKTLFTPFLTFVPWRIVS